MINLIFVLIRVLFILIGLKTIPLSSQLNKSLLNTIKLTNLETTPLSECSNMELSIKTLIRNKLEKYLRILGKLDISMRLKALIIFFDSIKSYMSFNSRETLVKSDLKILLK